MAKPTVSANGLTIVHKGSKGKLNATIPDICKIPCPPGGPVPIPLPNIAKAKDLAGGTVTVQIEGNSVAVAGSVISRSKGDKPGVLGGIVSGMTEGPATTIMFSPDVVMEMRPVIRKADKAIMNGFNTVCLSGWDQPDIEGEEATVWVAIKVLRDDDSDDPNDPVKGVKLKVTLPDGSKKEVETDPAGKVSFVDIQVGSCSVELNEPDDSYVLEITDRWPSTHLYTKKCHKIAVKIMDISASNR